MKFLAIIEDKMLLGRYINVYDIMYQEVDKEIPMQKYNIINIFDVSENNLARKITFETQFPMQHEWRF